MVQKEKEKGENEPHIGSNLISYYFRIRHQRRYESESAQSNHILVIMEQYHRCKANTNTTSVCLASTANKSGVLPAQPFIFTKAPWFIRSSTTLGNG